MKSFLNYMIQSMVPAFVDLFVAYLLMVRAENKYKIEVQPTKKQRC